MTYFEDLKWHNDGTMAGMEMQVLGLQGALLAPILGPVYLDSCVVSESSYNHEALKRAFGSRISHVSAALPAPYRLQQPRVLDVEAGVRRGRFGRGRSLARRHRCLERRHERNILHHGKHDPLQPR